MHHLERGTAKDNTVVWEYYVLKEGEFLDLGRSFEDGLIGDIIEYAIEEHESKNIIMSAFCLTLTFHWSQERRLRKYFFH